MITRVGIVERDEEGNLMGGVVFFYTPGEEVILYQTWEYSCSGHVYGPVNPDPIGSDGLLEYLMGAWLGKREDHEYEIDGASITANYR
jgi:hypothetical protein